MVANLALEKINPDDLFLHLLPDATRQAFLRCCKLSLLKNSDWYLAGGTALALQIGHRQSVDLDFFTAKAEFPAQKLERKLKSLVYFVDADSDPMPKLFFKASWPEVKKYFLKEVPAVTRKLLKL